MSINLSGQNIKETFGAIAKTIRESLLDPVKLTVLATELERFSKVSAAPAGAVEKQATEEDTPKAAPPEPVEKKDAPEEPAPKKTTKKVVQDLRH